MVGFGGTVTITVQAHLTGIPVPRCMQGRNETMRLWSLLSITHSRFKAGEASEFRSSDFIDSPFKHSLTPQMKEHSTAGWKQEIHTQQWRTNGVKGQKKASSEMNDVSKDPEKTIWGGENCLLLLNEDLNNQFQREGFKTPQTLCRNKLFSTRTQHLLY